MRVSHVCGHIRAEVMRSQHATHTRRALLATPTWHFAVQSHVNMLTVSQIFKCQGRTKATPNCSHWSQIKSIKSISAQSGGDFPRTHDVMTTSLLRQNDAILT